MRRKLKETSMKLLRRKISSKLPLTQHNYYYVELYLAQKMALFLSFSSFYSFKKI